ncbi:tetratricopeptide repeat protein [Fulvivirga sedimenti]|uniref:Tetratricopeptide repeat protein n=1 Tax=Fulvivirga sedimenti TaxID=2879465 RepID=A0A9X1KZ35_9BACT|nr:tetratricopeptide repeat protein [Fulvivirga sedimenti]MCA6078513.1 tetratricopeptide repeat protein [Fulvivirga sedimenti]
MSTGLFGQDTKSIQLANEYYGQGDFDKARAIYEKLVANQQNIPLIHSNYFFLLLETGSYDDAEDYLDKLLKRNPENIYYHLDLGYLYSDRGDEDKARKKFQEIREQVKTRPHLVRIVADYLINKQFMQEAVETFLTARRASGNPYDYSLEMANIYRIMNEKDLMVQEYLNYVSQNPGNLKYVQNTLQNLLTEPAELESLEYLLYDKIQKNPDENIYNELLIWVHLQQRNFYGAFIQARAIDKRLQTNGSRSLNIGTIALDNNDYNNAIKIFSYLIKEYPDTYNYILARMYLIRSYEQRVRNTFPVDKREISNLIHDYDIFISELGNNRSAYEAMRSKALLHAFYVDEKDSAIQILNEVIAAPQAGDELIARSKLDLGNIYILDGQPWESSLLYSQVEKSRKEDLLGYEAKLRNAKLSYYQGDFELAQAHLDILKQATTRTIANDAMALSILIRDNSYFDSTQVAMKDYARVELLLFQNKDSLAIELLDSMKLRYPRHPINDEILWLEAKLMRRSGNFEKAAELLEEIYASYPEDLWGDDAYFTLGEIYERNLNDKDKAMEIYGEFLRIYPGSIYVVEARKRYRSLRGDFNSDGSL